MSAPFASAGAPSSGIKWADHEDALLAIRPKEVKSDIDTTYGKADAVLADVWVVEQDGTVDGEAYPDCLIFPKLLQSQTRSKMGEIVLGRLGKGQAKPGQSAPWLLSVEISPDDLKQGEAWFERRKAAAAGTTPTPAAAPKPATVATGQDIPF